MIPSGCATHCPPTMNWYSVFDRKLSAMPPCHPAMPTPPFTASSSPRSCSFVIVPIVQIGTTRLSDCISSASAYASSVSFTTTSNSRSANSPANNSAHCFGSCPTHPPQTINARFFIAPFPHLSRSTASRSSHQRPPPNAFVSQKRMFCDLFLPNRCSRTFPLVATALCRRAAPDLSTHSTLRSAALVNASRYPNLRKHPPGGFVFQNEPTCKNPLQTA